MNDEPEGLRESLRELASEARRRQGPDAHPSPETLTAYHAGQLTPAAEEEAQEHLAVCPHCVRLLLDLPAFLAVPAAHREGPDVGAEASWQAIRACLPGPPEKTGHRREPTRARGSSPRQAWPRLAIAAMFAGAAVIAVPLWIIAGHLSSPELPPATLELSMPEARRGTAEPPPMPPATVDSRAVSTTFLLRLARPQPDLRFRVELLAGGGANAAGAPAGRILPVPAVKMVDSRTLVLVLARRELSPGRYRLLVLDAEQPTTEPLGDFEFQVIEP
jgi:hypothetical protein